MLPFGFQIWNMATLASVPLDTPTDLPKHALRWTRGAATADMETVKAAIVIR